MFYTYAKWIHKTRWIVIVLWVLVTIASVMWLPKLGTVVAQQSSNFLPPTSQVMKAQNLLNTINKQQSSKSSALVAIYRQSGLTQSDQAYFAGKLKEIDQHKSMYYVKYVQAKYNTNSVASKSFISSNKTTEIALIGITTNVGDPQMTTSLQRLRSVFKSLPQGAKVYFTGDAPIHQDDITISQSGTQKTEMVTIVLVLVILLMVFRSVVAPFATLIAIGLSFIVSSGVVAYFAQRGLPVSTFTQTFLIATIFGAGTDYSIIILNRYREELSKEHDDHVAALAETMHAVGKTVIFSSLTVLTSFAVLYFAKFGLYRSAVGVYLGISITLLMCLTFIPALMSILGRHIYFPRKQVAGSGHRPSRFWGKTAGLSTRYPWLTVLALIVVLAPIALLFTNERTFDPMVDIPQASSAQGFRLVSKSFGPGQVLPMNIVLHTSSNLRTPQGLATIESISRTIAGLSMVRKVESATRPVGQVIQGFQIATQNQQAAVGLHKINSGLMQLGGHLTQSGQKAAVGVPGIEKLANGSSQLGNGLQALEKGLGAISANSTPLLNGVDQVRSGSSQLAQSLGKVSSGMISLEQGSTQFQQGLGKAAAASGALSQGLTSYSNAQQQLATTAKTLADAMAKWALSHPSDANNPAWQQMMALAQGESKGLAQSATIGQKLAAGGSQISQSYPSLQKGSGQITNTIGSLAAGTKKLAAGATSLANGSTQLYSGTKVYTNGVKSAAKGIQPLLQGNGQITSGIQHIQSSTGQMTSGLNKAGSGTEQLVSGIKQVENYLNQSEKAKTVGNPGFYLPASELKTKGLKQAMNQYISPNGHVANITVILNVNPYTNSAMSAVPVIEAAANSALAASPVSNGEILLAGTTPSQSELNAISTEDFTRTVTIILSVIFLLLVLLLRSIITPLLIIISLSATYFVTMGIVQTVSIHILHQSGISWSVPFFAFLLLVALGVDYSIFLMSRFDEEYKKGLSVVESMKTAMSNMGNVIFSAALIMAGTFGSLTAAGMTTLVEIGLAIIVGLMLYAFVLIGFFLPATTVIIGHAHRWPRELFARKEVKNEKTVW